MRTPGQCTNVEGCWIGATHRNVWLSIGEDFACPNCGGVLTPPPRHAMSLLRLKKAAAIGAAMSVGVAATAMIGVKLSSFHWVPQPQAVASRHAGNFVLATLSPATLPAPLSAGQNTGGVPSNRATTSAPQILPPQSTALAADAELHTQPTFADPEKPGRIAARDSRVQPPTTLHGSEVLFASAADSTRLAEIRPATPRQSNAREISAREGSPIETRETAARDNEEPAFSSAAMVTMVSEAPFVLPIDDVRTLVVPVSFGKPPGPEDAAPPVSMRWRAHGMIRTRSSYFMPISGEPDSFEKICRTPADLR